MRELFLCKYGELSLKGENRGSFERRLCLDIRKKLKGLDLEVERKWGRLFVSAGVDQAERVARGLASTFGLVSFALALKTDKNIDRIEEAALGLAGSLLGRGAGSRFKIEGRRTDKSFPLTSYQIACRLGDALRAKFPELKVDLEHADWILTVEIREAAYLYGPSQPAPGGLPLGSSGKGLLLLSGGIDSPVAGYLMAKRGLKIDAVHFSTPPFTSEQSLEKVKRLLTLLSRFLTEINLYVVAFTETQLKIKAGARSEHLTLLMRACMVRIAALIARRSRAGCLVSGESLGQVASQTAESIRFTGSLSDLPLFRPLIGMDKEEIVVLARRIGTFETSILPYEDCCTLFAPAHPQVKPDFERMTRAYRSLELDGLLAQAAASAQSFRFPAEF